MKIQVTYEFPPGPGQREIRSRLESLEKNNLSEEEKLEKEELISGYCSAMLVPGPHPLLPYS